MTTQPLPDGPPPPSSILIIGSGIFGASTAYHLSLTHPSPDLITILDRTPYPPQHAASTDINKIVRADYTTPFYMDLASTALSAWKSAPHLQDESGKRFFHHSGWVVLSNRGNDIAERVRQNFKDGRSDGTRDVNLATVKQEWNGLLKETDLDDIVGGYENSDVGWVDAGDAVAEMVSRVVERGVRYVSGDVESLILGTGGIDGVKTKEGGVYKADKVLLATGAWTSQLLSPIEDQLDIKEDDRIEKQLTAAGVCIVHYKLSDEEYNQLKDAPVIIYGDKGESLPPPRHSRLQKFTNSKSFTNTITTPSGHRISVPPDEDQSIVPDSLKQETLDRIVSKLMPRFAHREVEHWRICWDSITPTQDQLITKHPDPRLANLYLAVGGSFHSWKFLPTIGEYVVNVLNGVSNGEEMNRRWAWKSGVFEGRGAHEKVVPRRELGDI